MQASAPGILPDSFAFGTSETVAVHLESSENARKDPVLPNS